ncbi:nucleotidyltransferase family protein [Microbacterium sp. AK031]|uniref:nucleotidyltransferase family protein n=1 Tax=Microbacterium sp. AK031 TaxID=2723076 RepID=UPI00216A39A4|nr:nucleotidyltransferase family protein [Microbacterium sp. AK031]MCS3841738.1 hypothetical protein [Microbacterium sp. AK031]
MSTTASTFRMIEAVELAHAVAQRLASDAGIRVLFIKGPTLTFHGLRDAWASSDVDLLVEPARFNEFCELLTTIEWHERAGIEALTVLHSKTFIKQTWPCDLDPHILFPGFLGDPADVFDALWDRRDEMMIAHQPCAISDKLGSILIVTLHALRGSSRHTRHERELATVKSLTLSAEEKIALRELARSTGSTATAAEVLTSLGVDATPTSDELSSEAYQEWQRRTTTSTHGAYPWLVAFIQGTPREKATILWHAFWPSEAELRRARPDTRPGVLGTVSGRIARWGRGIASLPGGVRMLRRQGSRTDHL